MRSICDRAVESVVFLLPGREKPRPVHLRPNLHVAHSTVVNLRGFVSFFLVYAMVVVNAVPDVNESEIEYVIFIFKLSFLGRFLILLELFSLISRNFPFFSTYT